MRRREIGGLLLLAGVLGCRPRVSPIDPPDPVETEEPPVDDTAPTGDTAPLPPCAVPESEPNDQPADADTLPMEHRGCGTFGGALDADQWRFEPPEAAWLAIDLEAWSLGSEADVVLTLSGEGVPEPFAMFDWLDRPDVRLRFPVEPTALVASVRQEFGDDRQPGQGEAYFYELRASIVKPPMAWNRVEEANETEATAQVVADGDVLFARLTEGDADWYRVDVPPGAHTVTVAVVGMAEGSPGDFALRRTDGRGGGLGIVSTGPVGWSPDPTWEYRAPDAGSLWFEVIEEDARQGAPFWYILDVDVTEDAP